MSLFPFIGDIEMEQEVGEDLPLAREYKWDFENDEFMLKDGKFIIVEGIEAVKVWVYKALKVAKSRYPIYSDEYGNNLERLIGKQQSSGFVRSQGQRYLRECLLINPYIRDVKNITVEFDNDVLKLSFTIETVYGEVDIVV